MNTAQERLPVLMSLGLIAIPVLYFSTIIVTTIPGGLIGHLFVAWTFAAISAALPLAITPTIRDYFSTSEQLAMLAGHGLIGLAVALTGYTATGLH